MTNTMSPDPIFPLIEAERAAWQAFTEADDAVADSLGEVATAALDAVMACRPTTAAGTEAMLGLCHDRLSDWIGHEHITVAFDAARAFLRERVGE